MLCVPDLAAALQQGMIDMEQYKAVQLAMIAHCELMADRVAILDPPPGMNAQQIKEWRVDEAGYDSKYATLYWPWVKIMDPLSGRADVHAAVGHDRRHLGPQRRHPRRAQGARPTRCAAASISLEINITKGEHDQLNPVAVNCIRSFPGQGIRVWGARTLSSDPEWRYLNVRRLFNYVEESILSGTNWVVFEPNDSKLWDSVKRTIEMFLRRRVSRAERCSARRPQEAFFVKCDAENNPPENRDARHPHRRDRHRAREAGRVRRVPDLPVRRRQRAERVSPTTFEGADTCLQEESVRARTTTPSPHPLLELTIDGHEMALFSALSGISSSIDVVDFIQSNARENILKKLPGKRTPPTVTLKRGMTKNIEMAAWHELVVLGDVAPPARRAR